MDSSNLKLKRIHCEKINLKENENETSCKCCKEVLKQFNAKFSEMKSEIKELKGIMQTQNEAIMAALATQKVVTQSLVRQEKQNATIKNAFPINTLEELEAVNGAISDENHQTYVNAMKLSLKGKLPKTLTTILSLQLILDINLDGTHGKKRLKDYGMVFDALMDAVRPLCDDPDKELRNALTVIKKRHFHAVCIDKKTKK